MKTFELDRTGSYRLSHALRKKVRKMILDGALIVNCTGTKEGATGTAVAALEIWMTDEVLELDVRITLKGHQTNKPEGKLAVKNPLVLYLPDEKEPVLKQLDKNEAARISEKYSRLEKEDRASHRGRIRVGERA